MITLREKKGEGRLLHILMGRARTGKSERVLQRIAALGDSSQQILLVPEHASHVAEMDLCRVCGDTASRHAEALTFKLLASRVLSICGGSADVTLDSGGKLLTLQRTLTELAPVLKVYKRPSQRAAFLESLLAVMEELQAYAVSPEQLSESVAQIEGESGDKLRDLSLIYGIYLSKLHAPGHDARDVLEKLEENLEASGYIENKDIFLDGFSYFTGRELRILRILLRRAKSVTVTLLGDTQDRELSWLAFNDRVLSEAHARRKFFRRARCAARSTISSAAFSARRTNLPSRLTPSRSMRRAARTASASGSRRRF